MGATDKNIKRDAGKIPIPQYFNPELNDFEAVHGKDGATNTRTQGIVNRISFHEVATVPGQGKTLTVGAANTLVIEIYGTSSDREIAFFGAGPSGIKHPITGTKMKPDMFAGVGTTGTGEIWLFDIWWMDFVTIELVSVSGGNVTVKGKALN